MVQYIKISNLSNPDNTLIFRKFVEQLTPQLQHVTLITAGCERITNSKKGLTYIINPLKKVQQIYSISFNYRLNDLICSD